jgi:hypothetical protein
MVYDTTDFGPYCLDPWCENPDPDRTPDHLCGCWILTPAERDAAERGYRQAQAAEPVAPTAK